MGKLKTKKGVAKRFKLTKKGKIKYYPGGKSHLASSKEPERIRHLRKGVSLAGEREQRFLKRCLPYG
ncbi:MAG: 50S ribosomal protein L35 [Candidatus Omnitrophica bacterium]|nr:50S ribosomal protein L35 [Candidatus Omnitrophota bacterium]MDD5512494.1 50S ribosomal protein L35 [Candidatus Omnitrophota bacterium]